MGTDGELPDYRKPPVVEIIAAVQFAALPRFGLNEMVSIARAFPDYQLLGPAPSIPPIVEVPLGAQGPQVLNFGFGEASQRLILESPDERWIVQIQQDRVAVHERKRPDRPSFKNLEPKLGEVVAAISGALERPLLEEPHTPELVELIYDNWMPIDSDGGPSAAYRRSNEALRVLARTAGQPPYGTPEHVTVAYSYALSDRGEFVGRLHVESSPQVVADGERIIHLRIFSRRYLRQSPLQAILDRCHADIVEGFTAITTPTVQKEWERVK